MINNYFKLIGTNASPHSFIPFDDTKPKDRELAWEEASILKRWLETDIKKVEIASFKPLTVPGPWSDTKYVGEGIDGMEHMVDDDDDIE